MFGAYKNRTDIDLFDNIDNIFFVTLDLVLGFNTDESAYGIIADYILENIPKYKTSDRKSVLEAIQALLLSISLTKNLTPSLRYLPIYHLLSKFRLISYSEKNISKSEIFLYF